MVVFSRSLAELIARGDRSATMPGPRSEIILAGPRPITDVPEIKGPTKAITDFDPYNS
jgi:hypothetical protein